MRDAALIVDGNKVEHYEVAIYGSLVAFAQQLGFRGAVATLQETLEEESGRRQIDPTGRDTDQFYGLAPEACSVRLNSAGPHSFPDESERTGTTRHHCRNPSMTMQRR